MMGGAVVSTRSPRQRRRGVASGGRSAVGGLGALAAVISLETPNGPLPNWLTPRTSNVYFCPGFSPVTVRVVVGAMLVVLITVAPDFTTKS